MIGGYACGSVSTSSTPASAYTDMWDWRATQYESFAIGKINTEVGTNGRYERLKVWDDYGTDRGNFRAAMREAFGPQQVKLNGVPTDSRYARVLVAADFRM